MAKALRSSSKDDHNWISISDMMSGLMMVFLFIAVSYMLNVLKEKNKIKEIAVTYNKLQNSLYEDLYAEFKNDLSKWNAVIDRQSLSVRFEEPDVLFEQGSSVLRLKFVEILDDFFPRYIRILTNEKYRNEIDEIRIEGHTSSEWSEFALPDIAYINNMRLSQDRTRSVLEYVINL